MLLVGLLNVATFGGLAIAQANGGGTTKKPTANRSTQTKPASIEGQQRFETHCGRCHNSPEDISSREARAVARHMRVRAMLTAEDERLILEFLAP